MRLVTSIAAIAGCLLAFCSPASASIILRLETSDSSTINSGDSVTVNLFLDDDTGLLNAEGLGTGGARLLLDSLSLASVTVNTVTPNAGFDDSFGPTIYGLGDPLPDFAPPGYENVAGFYAITDLFSPPVGVGTNSVLLGSFALTIVGNPGDTATFLPFTLANDPTDSGAFIGTSSFETFSNLDALVTSHEGLSFTISSDPNVGTVPEPATLLMFMAGLPVLLWSCRCRKQILCKSEG